MSKWWVLAIIIFFIVIIMYVGLIYLLSQVNWSKEIGTFIGEIKKYSEVID